MPFKSKSQRRKFYALKAQGKMSQSMIDKWESHTPKDKPLPEKVASIRPNVMQRIKKKLKIKNPLGTTASPTESPHIQELRRTMGFPHPEVGESEHIKDLRKQYGFGKYPDLTEKKAHMINFWKGFEKKAAETFVSAQSPMDYPGAPEKMLKWNTHGGVDPKTPEELQAAEASGLRTLPPDLPGAKCGTCIHFRPLTEPLGHGFCTHPEIKMDTTEHMHCMHWENPEAHDPVQAAQEEAQQQEMEAAQQAQQSGMMGGQPGQPGQPGDQGMGGQPGGQGMPSENAMGQQGEAAGADMGAGAATAGAAGGADLQGQAYQPSPVGGQSGFPMGPQSAKNPMVEEAVQDFQGQNASAGPTGAEAGGKPKSSKPSSSKKPKKESGKDSKGSTINIHVGSKGAEKTSSVGSFWRGIVDGY